MTGGPSPGSGDRDEHSPPVPQESLAALIKQMQENWDQGNNAANDELVVRIRDHIRRQRAAAAPGGHTIRRRSEHAAEDDGADRGVVIRTGLTSVWWAD